MKRTPHILFACGGTGGHVYPAIAIADAVRARAPEAVVAFAGTRDHMEWEAVPKAGYPIHAVTVSGFHRELSLRTLTFFTDLLQGLYQSWRLVGDFDPDVVVGTGGYVAGPVGLVGSLRGTPVLIQEQNAYAGVTNRLLAHRAARVHVAFPEAKDYFPDPERCVLSGNPTRRELTEADPAEGRRHWDLPDDGRVLFVFGGSLGSQALNEAVERHREALLADETVHLVWQTGARYYEKLRERVPEHPRVRLVKYVDRMDLTYAAADLALCRAGAITCSELMVTGTSAVLVPSPNVAEDHQTKNARSMSTHGAAELLPESRLLDDLVATVQALMQDDDRRRAMSEAARKLAHPDAADRIAQDVLALAAHRST